MSGSKLQMFFSFKVGLGVLLERTGIGICSTLDSIGDIPAVCYCGQSQLSWSKNMEIYA